MRGSSFKYLVKMGFKSIHVNRVMSFAAIGVLISCMLLIGSAMLFSLNVGEIVGYVEQQNEVVVFLDMDLQTDEKNLVEKKIKSLDNISSSSYISGKEGILEWMETLGDDAVYLEGLEDEEILPDSYRLKLKDLSSLESTVKSLENIEGIEKVVAPVEVANTLSNIQYAVYFSGMVIVCILIAASFVIIGNTIKITVFNRRKEIEIMKVVGATDTYVRFPFFVEGFLLGLISATLAFFLLWGGYELVIRWLGENNISFVFSFTNNLIEFKNIALPLYLSFLLGGTLVGTSGSMIFVRKYLKI